MPRFSNRSKSNLEEAHPDLRAVANFAIQYVDFSVIEGSRSKEKQERMVEEGKSQLHYPNSKHNVGEEAGRELSHAIDVVPYPVDWQDRGRFIQLSGYFYCAHGILTELGIVESGLRWGGNWDMDEHLDDNKFDDLGHYEVLQE